MDKTREEKAINKVKFGTRNQILSKAQKVALTIYWDISHRRIQQPMSLIGAKMRNRMIQSWEDIITVVIEGRDKNATSR